MLRNYEFDSVLDIGCGAGTHADILLKHGKHVTAIDYGKSSYFERMKQQKGIKTIIGDINNHSFDELFDGVWASHVLEHQLTPHLFLKRLHGLL
ncbi:MAG: class I SAM-dependent methyltransferase, partial [Gammaproteobacteria bacterium]|nr:class I SAM-dependent methyltransferase [Gammaproteobacteria bacterium]